MAAYCVVYNPAAGSAASIEEIKKAFSVHKISPEFIAVTANLKEKIQKQAKSGCKIFVAAGGDGTINSLVNALPNYKYKLGIIPAGTRNHLAKDLAIPGGLNQAVEVIIHGKERKIDIASVNDQLFLNNSVIGLYTHIVSRRVKYFGWPGKRLSDFFNLPGILARPRTYNVELEIDGRKVSRQSSLIFIGNNSYKIRRWGLTNRSHFNSGKLCLYLIKTHSGPRLVWLFLKVLGGKAHTEADFEEYFAKEITINSPKRSLKVSLDGEVKYIKPPLRYKSLPKELAVIVA